MDARALAADNLKRLRAAHGLSVKKLSEKSGISRNTIKTIEDNRNAVAIDTLEAIAVVFGCQVWELLRPYQPAAQKAVPRTPGPKAQRKPTGEAAELLQSLIEVHRQVRKSRRGAEEHHDKVPAGSYGDDRNKPRPKGGPKVVKDVKARSRP